MQTARWAGEGKEPVTGRTRLTRLTVPHMAAPLSQTAYRSPQGFSPNHRAPIVFWWPFWLLEDGEEARSERRRQRQTHPQVPHNIWHLAPQTQLSALR